MPTTKILLKLGALLAVLAAGAGAATPGFRVPPLNDPATTVSQPGKFVWVDLFTADAAVSTRFYADLFGWEWETLGTGAQSYHLAYHAGYPVAGAVNRPPGKGDKNRARWIGYIAVADIAATERQVRAHGGQTLLAPRAVPDRGQLAIMADPEGALFGLLQSSSGDPADYQPELYEWNWAQLFAGDAAKALAFYHEVFGYDNDASPDGGNFFVSAGVVRAGLSQLPADTERHPSWLGFVSVADVTASAAKARSLGGSVLLEPRHTAGGAEVAIIADPTGAALGLVKLDPKPNGEK